MTCDVWQPGVLYDFSESVQFHEVPTLKLRDAAENALERVENTTVRSTFHVWKEDCSILDEFSGDLSWRHPRAHIVPATIVAPENLSRSPTR